MRMKQTLAAACVAGLTICAAAPAVAEENSLYGEIQAVAQSWCPAGWSPLDGTVMPIADNATLYALIGAAYGGDGHTTFALPDMRERALIGYGQGPGLTPYALGQRGGRDGVALLQANMPAHTHLVMGATSDPARNTPQDSAIPTIPNPARAIYTDAPPNTAIMAPNTVVPNGESQELILYQPSLFLTFCMATGGSAQFPQRP